MKSESGGLIRLLIKTGWLVLVTLVVLACIAFEGYLNWLPVHYARNPSVFLLLIFGPVLTWVLTAMTRLERVDTSIAAAGSKVLKYADMAKDLVAGHSAVAAIGVISLLLVSLCVIWVPEYLVQPIWTDHEHMLVMADLWERGLFPWTSMLTYQFPGGMELAWLAMKVGERGNPTAFFAMNLVLYLILSLMSMKWCKRQLGHWAYGLGTVLGLLLQEAALPFTVVAQRDTQATILSMMAFLAPGLVWSRIWGGVLSGLLFGFAVSVRPHTGLFMPLVLTGLCWGGREIDAADEATSNEDMKELRQILFWRRFSREFVRTLLIWFMASGIGFVICMSPVIGPGRTGAFLKALEYPMQQEGSYSNGLFAEWTSTAWAFYEVPRHFLFLGFCGWMLMKSGEWWWRKCALVLTLMAISGGMYRAVHPVDHGYLKLPLNLWECLGFGIFTAWLIGERGRIRGLNWFAAFGFMAVMLVPVGPVYLSVEDAGAAIAKLLVGKPLMNAPPGALAAYPLEVGVYHYNWADWVESEKWVRANTNKDTRIMNLLSYQPYPPYLGSVGRLPLGRLESIVMMNWFKKVDFEKEMVDVLRNARAGSLVIWDNERMDYHLKNRLPELIRLIPKVCRKAAQFGEIEIWEKMRSENEIK